ncbi:MrcB family domain-containing protein [Paenibacillus sp. GCM10028914]|uniref:MrcB family domain-containing protein n=1 Tax=Paenibacillus sp. GCM10028914 TaxID=3273416 RepID=UPI00361658A9
MLPEQLSSIFRVKQKSYKMILILSLIQYYEQTKSLSFPLSTIAERFLAYFQENSAEGKKVDLPPGKASQWSDITLSQSMSLLKTPLEALSSILEIDDSKQVITFHPDVADQLDDSVIQELKQYALSELQSYNDKLTTHVFSLHHALTEIMDSYTSARNQAFAGHPLGTLFRQSIPEQIKSLSFIGPNYKIQGSVGQGNWANIPWIAVMDKRITDTTQHGEYIVYLFSEDMESVYLTLAQGVTAPKDELGKKEGYQYLEDKANEMRKLLPLEGMQKDDGIHLTSKNGLGRDYQVSTVAYIRYDRGAIPDDAQLQADLENVVTNYKMYVEHVLQNKKADNKSSSVDGKESPSLSTLTVSEQVKQIKTHITHQGFHYPGGLIENLYLSLKTKPFVILAGVSGTGKTKLVKLFAEAVGATKDNGQFALIPVRPDWSDPSDLLGYKDLSGVFRSGRLAEVLVDASKPENQHKPYFICLDEMNLARVEYYFSDILSVIETQEWKQDRIVTSALIHRESLLPEDQSLYGGLAIPDNVYLIGTVNMDETTHPFSKKVLDRANTIEFNYIDLQQYPMTTSREEETLLPVHNSFLRNEYLQLVDVYSEYTELVQSTTEKLVKINHILEEIHSHVGFRIRDSICFYMIYNERFGLLSKEEAFDLQLLQKILPRVQGSSLSVKRVLLKLLQGTLGEKLPINNLLDDASEVYLKWNENQEEKKAKHPQSARKIAFMLRRLEEDGFTSYWLS